jgi:hypothetical protein
VRKDPVERSAGTPPGREHTWNLVKRTFGDDENTRFDWRCAHCLSDTFTKATGSTPEEEAYEFLPGRRALQATWVPEDCGEALVQAVCEL